MVKGRTNNRHAVKHIYNRFLQSVHMMTHITVKSFSIVRAATQS